MKISLEGLSVYIGIPSTRDFSPETTLSLWETGRALEKMGIRCELEIICNNAIITKARDEVFNGFLASDCNRFFMIDSDIKWNPQSFIKLLAWTQLMDCVAAAYPMKRDDHLKGCVVDTEDETTNELGLIEVNGLGLGFTVITEKLAKELCKGRDIYLDKMTGCLLRNIYRTDTVDGCFRGEDMAFFADIRELGYKVYVDPSVPLGHIGTKTWEGALMPVEELTENAEA